MTWNEVVQMSENQNLLTETANTRPDEFLDTILRASPSDFERTPWGLLVNILVTTSMVSSFQNKQTPQLTAVLNEMNEIIRRNSISQVFMPGIPSVDFAIPPSAPMSWPTPPKHYSPTLNGKLVTVTDHFPSELQNEDDFLSGPQVKRVIIRLLDESKEIFLRYPITHEFWFGPDMTVVEIYDEHMADLKLLSTVRFGGVRPKKFIISNRMTLAELLRRAADNNHPLIKGVPDRCQRFVKAFGIGPTK